MLVPVNSYGHRSGTGEGFDPAKMGERYDPASTGEGFDPASKAWMVAFCATMMLLIQWPASFLPHSKNPPQTGSIGWTLVAAFIGLVPPLIWLASDIKRLKSGWPWALSVAVIGLFAILAIGWAKA